MDVQTGNVLWETMWIVVGKENFSVDWLWKMLQKRYGIGTTRSFPQLQNRYIWC